MLSILSSLSSNKYSKKSFCSIDFIFSSSIQKAGEYQRVTIENWKFFISGLVLSSTGQRKSVSKNGRSMLGFVSRMHGDAGVENFFMRFVSIVVYF